MRAPPPFSQTADVAVIGAGAAGMLCAALAGQRGRRVVLIDHASRIGEKIRISGGGRCNFTNRDTGVDFYTGADPSFAAHALRDYPPREFLALLKRHRVPWHEKHRGQLFCDRSSQDIVDLLRAECVAGRVQWRHPCQVHAVRPRADGFELDCSGGALRATRVVVATGGLPVAKIGASDWGLKLATAFGLPVVTPRPALVPLQFAPSDWQPYAELAGISAEVGVACGAQRFDEDLLFTHRGLSGPAILQISSYWEPGASIAIDLAPGQNLGPALVAAKAQSRQSLLNHLAALLPRRLAQAWCEQQGLPAQQRLAELGDARLRQLGAALQQWTLRPAGDAGWNKAEVMRGGVATAALDPVTLESRQMPGLHWIGEVVDITGHLGGFNFQWAWASAAAAARAL